MLSQWKSSIRSKGFARSALLAAMLVALPFTTVNAARSLTGVTVEWAPHYGSTLESGGALTVIVKEAFLRSGYAAEVSFIPWNRALKNVEDGVDDFVMGAYFNEERARTFWVSDPIYSVDLGLVALNSLEIGAVEDLRTLTPYRIGVSRGFANTPEFDQADFLNKDFASSPKLNLRKLFRQRVDIIVGAHDIFRYQARIEKMMVDRLTFLQPPLQSNPLHLLISRKVPDGKKLVDNFNRELSAMREDGSLKALLARHLNRGS